MRWLLRLLGSRLPRVDGELRAPVKGEVTVRRDRHGVAYVEAGGDDDAFFGLGFAEAQDRAFQIELFVRAARGTVAELVGPDMLDADRLARRIGFRRIAEAQLLKLAPPSRTQFESYARGVNFGLKQGRSHEQAILGAPPFEVQAADCLALLQFVAFALSSNWDAELARLKLLLADGPEALDALEVADPALLEGEAGSRLESDVRLLQAAEQLSQDADRLRQAAPTGGASNNWVLAPSRTTTGRPLLASDPHLGPVLPAYWYLAHVRTPGWAVSGAWFPLQPVPSIGHNERVAWGLTTGHHDNTDLFVEKLSQDGTRALRGGAWEACEVRDEVIRVKGKPDVVERVVVTPRGPILTPLLPSGGPALSMRATWMAPRELTVYQLFRARTVEEAREQFRVYPGDTESRVFADVDGHIGWQLAGDAPVRKAGHGLLPAPAWDPATGWEDEPLPFEQLPGVSDPPEGFAASANQRPTRSTGAFLGADWLDGARFERIVESLRAREKWDVEATMKLQLDRASLHWRAMREKVLAALEGAGPAAELLKSWDGVVAADSVAAAIYEVWFAELICRACRAKAPKAWRAAVGEGINALVPHGNMALRRPAHMVRLILEQPEGWFARGWPAELRSCLEAAVAQLTAAAGGDMARWAWGRVRPLTLVHPMGEKPVLRSIFNLGPIAVGGDVSTLPQASVPFEAPLSNPIGIANLRAVIDVGNWEASRWSLAGGQSGNPLSPHYGDLLAGWEKGEGIAMAWSQEAVRRAAASTLSLRPG